MNKVGSLRRNSRTMLKVDHTFKLRNLCYLGFVESEILFGYETQFEDQTDSNLFVVTTSEFSISLSTKS